MKTKHIINLKCSECGKEFNFIVQSYGFKKLSDDTMNILTNDYNSIASCCYCESIIKYQFRSSISLPSLILIEIPNILTDKDNFYVGLR